MGEPIRVNFMLDEKSYDSAQQKRPFSTSALLRWFLKLMSSTDKEWEKLTREDEEVRIVSEYVRPRLRKVFGVK